MTEKTFGNFELHVEFNVPYMPDAHGQGRGNSGVYLTGNHELQVLDSYGLKSQDNDCGAIYKQVAPAVNACKPPLQWQTYDITFHKAVVEGRQGREEGPRHGPPERRQDHRQRRDLADARRHRRSPKARTARSCSRTTATRSSIGTSGSSRWTERCIRPDIDAAVAQRRPRGLAAVRMRGDSLPC